MKKIFLPAITLILTAVVVFCFASCREQTDSSALWENATYTSDQTFGEGETTVFVEVKAEEKSVTFTINTNQKILGDALIDHAIIEGEQSQYGIYIKKVNGITADYNIDQSYWSVYKNGEYMMSGVDGITISNGDIAGLPVVCQ